MSSSPSLPILSRRSSSSAADFFERIASRVRAARERWRSEAPAEAPERPRRGNELRAALLRCKAAFIGLFAASAILNLLMLVGPLFMLQVYDRVLPSRSVPTLIGLGLLALFLFCGFGFMDMLRNRMLVRVARAWHEQLGNGIFDNVLQAALRTGNAGFGMQPLRDLETLRGFMAGPALTAVFDLPWMPLYVGICFLFHPWIGVAVLVGAALLCVFTCLTEIMSRGPTSQLVAVATARQNIADTALRNAVAVHALGMRRQMAERWSTEGAAVLDAQQRLADVTSGFGGLSRTFRIVLQSGILALGAFLVIRQEATAGVMLAATIISVRALAPVEMAIANWRGFLAARQSWQRLSTQFAAYRTVTDRTKLAPPSSSLRATSLTLLPPGGHAAVLHNVTFTLDAGSVLGVVGPSGSGKSSLARTLVGAWTPARGAVRLDGAMLSQWEPDEIGRHIGFLPQEVMLFPGTIAQNIARFATDADPEAIRKAARDAGMDELILRLPQGYETQVGEGGALLSGGQRQRIGLARALYGDPFLVVLDEPNANLDGAGETALARAIAAVRQRKGIVVLIAHRPQVLRKTDFLLVLNEGHVQGFGPTATLLPKILGQAPKPAQAADKPRPITGEPAHAAAG